MKTKGRDTGMRESKELIFFLFYGFSEIILIFCLDFIYLFIFLTYSHLSLMQNSLNSRDFAFSGNDLWARSNENYSVSCSSNSLTAPYDFKDGNKDKANLCIANKSIKTPKNDDLLTQSLKWLRRAIFFWGKHSAQNSCCLSRFMLEWKIDWIQFMNWTVYKCLTMALNFVNLFM